MSTTSSGPPVAPNISNEYQVHTSSPEFFDLLMTHAANGLEKVKKYNENKTIHSGWIYKRGETVKSWRRRFLRVTPQDITYGKDATHVLKSISRGTIKHVEPCPHSDAPKEYREFGIKVVTDKRCLKVAVQTKREQDAFIYHISPKRLFGTDIDLLMTLESHAHATAPVVIEQSIHELTKDGKLSTKGLFRVSGSDNDMKNVTHLYDTAYITCDEHGKWSKNPLSNISTHVAAGILKKYLRELPDSIIPEAEYETVMDIFKGNLTDEEKVVRLKTVISRLSRNRYVTLNMVCFTLYQTHLHNELMKASNLGLVMGQNLLKQNSVDMSEVMLMAKIAEFLIVQYEQLFEKDAEYLNIFKRNIEAYSVIAQDRKDKLCKELALLKLEANEIDEAMSKLSNLVGTMPELSEQLYSQIYHAVYHVRVNNVDAESEAGAQSSAPVSYKSLFLDSQLKKHDLLDLIQDVDEELREDEEEVAFEEDDHYIDDEEAQNSARSDEVDAPSTTEQNGQAVSAEQ